MASRTSAPRAGSAVRETSPCSIDLVCVRPVGDRLGVFAPRRGTGPALPTTPLGAGESLAAAAKRLASEALGAAPRWIEQLGAFADGLAHPSGAALSVAFVAVLPADPAADPAAWLAVPAASGLTARQRVMTQAAWEHLQRRLDDAPIAFHLLPERFSLGELQEMYERLLERPLHKASFRRSLDAAELVVATDAWRQDGRGRPAQLYRYSPKKRRPEARTLRFDVTRG